MILMNGIHAEGGSLWQWDLGREVHVEDFEPGDLLDMARSGSCDALTVALDDEGMAPIPNALLKRAGTVEVYQRRGDATVDQACLTVLERPKPPDYVYSATPTVGYAELERRVAALEAGGGTGGGKVQEVEPPLVLDGSTLKVDLSGVRGTQVTTGDAAPSSAANRGDTYIRTNGELWEFTDIPGTE